MLSTGCSERTMRKQIEQLVRLNECQRYRLDRAALTKILDEAFSQGSTAHRVRARLPVFVRAKEDIRAASGGLPNEHWGGVSHVP